MNRVLYDTLINESENGDEARYLDLALHIHLIDNNLDFGVQEIVDFLDDMDVEDIDELTKKYDEMKFSTNKTKEFTCVCGEKTKFEIDVIPDFFPDSWTE